jgi:hypothetical protein
MLIELSYVNVMRWGSVMNEIEIRARYKETKAYLEAAAVTLEGAAQTDRVKETRKLLEHANTALYELGRLREEPGLDRRQGQRQEPDEPRCAAPGRGPACRSAALWPLRARKLHVAYSGTMPRPPGSNGGISPIRSG